MALLSLCAYSFPSFYQFPQQGLVKELSCSLLFSTCPFCSGGFPAQKSESAVIGSDCICLRLPHLRAVTASHRRHALPLKHAKLEAGCRRGSFSLCTPCFLLPTQIMSSGINRKHFQQPSELFCADIALFSSVRTWVVRGEHWFTTNYWSLRRQTFFYLFFLASSAALLLELPGLKPPHEALLMLAVAPITNCTITSPRHDLSPSGTELDVRHSISYCSVCPWSWRCVYTTHIPVSLPPCLSSFPLRLFQVTIQPNYPTQIDFCEELSVSQE